MQERFFYHSFPRRGRDGSQATSKGLAILQSIIRSGLLLTPEKIEWTEFLQDGTQSPSIQMFQKRICFTELAPLELAEHARAFGPFAVEFSIENLRLLGGIPVFYLPKPSTRERDLEGIASALVARLADVQQLLTRLTELARLVQMRADKSELLNVTRNGTVVGVTRCNIGGAEDLLRILSFQIQPPQELLNAIRALASFFYPTENLTYTGPLAYYRQREWRIIGNMVRRGVQVARDLTPEEKDILYQIDRDFFELAMVFPTGEYRRADQCLYFSELVDTPILGRARRVIVPDDAKAEAENLLRQHGFILPVISTSELA
jgi:hypothetical protein